MGETHRIVAISADSVEERRRYRLEALACFRQTEDLLFISTELYALAGLDFLEDRVPEGRAYLEEAISVAASLGAEIFLYFFYSDLSVVLLDAGEVERAAALIRRGLVVARRQGLRLELCGLIFAAACCWSLQGDLVRAARLHGAADRAVAIAIGAANVNWSRLEERLRESDQARLRSAMNEGEFQREYDAGAALSTSRAVDLALNRVET
jgi:hypothetical protein